MSAREKGLRCWWWRSGGNPDPLVWVVDPVTVEHVLPRRVDDFALDRLLRDHGRRRLHDDWRRSRTRIGVVVVRVPRVEEDTPADEGMEAVVMVEAPMVAVERARAMVASGVAHGLRWYGRRHQKGLVRITVRSMVKATVLAPGERFNSPRRAALESWAATAPRRARQDIEPPDYDPGPRR
jgi:hypothetical protein